MPLLALSCRGLKAGIERRPLGNNSSPALTASKEIGTSVLQQQCSGFPQQRERALSKFFLESPAKNPADCLDFALTRLGAEKLAEPNQTVDIQSCKIINLYCFKPPNLKHLLWQ